MKARYVFFILIMMILFGLDLSAQTFKIIESESPYIENKLIGSDLILSFDKNYLKIKVNVDNVDEVVLKKQTRNIYTAIIDNHKAEAVLDFHNGYLRGGTVKVYKYLDGKQIGKILFKRKENVTIPYALDENIETNPSKKSANGDGLNDAKYEIYVGVEESAEFPGGLPSLLRFIAQNIVYPKEAQEKDIQGRVIVKMVIDADGNVVNPIVLKGVDESLDMEALRLVKSLPKWIPAKVHGKVVSSYYTLPINFRLQAQ